MKFRKTVSLTSMILGMSALAGCGGDGGGSGVSSVSSTPAATNASLAALRASQSFTNNAATGTAAFDLASSKTLSGSTAVAPLTIAYDAGSNSYTISTQGRSQTFAPANLSSAASGQSVYAKSDGANSDRLTLFSASVTGASANGPQYVGMGFWQRNTSNSGTQNTTLDIFTYGIDTPASGVPRTGQAAYSTSVFGLATTPGYEPVSFQGTGRFDVNFLTGVFSTSASTTETGLVSGNGITGGGIGITGSGHLSSSDGTFSGTVGYGGQNAMGQGALAGHFYGPTGTELGATFSASGTDGSAASGAIVGLQNPSLAATNLGLTSLMADQLYYPKGVQFERVQPATSDAYAIAPFYASQAQQTVAGGFSVGSGAEFGPQVFAASDQVAASQPNFTSYQKTLNGQSATLDLYKSGAANTELALTYLSFGRWNASAPQNDGSIYNTSYYFVYGFPTAASAIAARTGTASYSGVAYGAAFNAATGAAYDVTGTSTFNVDFSHSTYSGALALKGSGSAGATNFGTFGFASTLSSGVVASANLTQGGGNVGTINPGFFGPAGEEIGGPFQISVPTGQAGKPVTIAGVAVAKGG